MTVKLIPDTQAPALSLPLVGSGHWVLNDPAPETFTMIVFYRGLHCPVCRTYLERLNGLVGGFQAEGFEVLAASMNNADDAAQTVRDWDIGALKVACGLSEATARAWGLWLTQAIKPSEAEIFCEPGLFWVRPDGRLYLMDISNMPWPRPDLELLLSKAAFVRESGYPARGTF
jgi:peroxiredoxin